MADTVTALAWGMIAVAVPVFMALHCVAAPFGRYSINASWIYGFPMNGTVAWVIQELPALVGVVYAWAQSPGALVVTPRTVLFALFTLHYFNRTLVFPFRLRGGKPTPIVVCALAFFFCSYNG
jgi:3-oxo-5-alpha-steroid 4-dehydrogenase 1